MTWTKYDYFAAPDGEEVENKLMYLLPPTIGSAIYLSLADMMLLSKPCGYSGILRRMAFYVIPVVGMTSTFVCLTNVLSYERQPDTLNWFMAGAASGAIMGVWRRSFSSGFWCGLLFGTAAAIKKQSYFSDWKLAGNRVPVCAGGLWSPRHDFTLTEDPLYPTDKLPHPVIARWF